jgi:hypothetical protein
MRTYIIANGTVRYVKDHGWHNQYNSQKVHGSFDCKFKLIRLALGALWKWCGIRVLR